MNQVEALPGDDPGIAPATGGLSLQCFDGAVLHLDIVGFSTISRQMERRGQRGAEDLAELLTDFFSGAIGAAMERGALVGGLAGDAMTAAWPEREGSAARRALAAAFAIVEATRPFADRPDTPLRARLSMATGPFARFVLPTGSGQSVEAFAGAAVERAVSLNERAPPGGIAADARLAAAVAGAVEVAATAEGVCVLAPGTFLPGDLGDAPAPLAAPALPTPLALAWQRLAGDRLGGIFRDLTVISLDLAGGARPVEIPPERIATRLAWAHRILAAWGGHISTCTFEEKGIVVQAVFGLSPEGPADTANHAIEAALALAEAPDRPMTRLPVGVATGLMFLGRYGHASLPAVSAFGWQTTLATRLMQAAGAGVLCDAATRRRVERKIAIAEAGEIRVKGSDEAVRIARPSSRGGAAVLAEPLVGRGPALADLARVLEAPGAPASPVLVRGPPGIGKTRLCRALTETARRDGWEVAWRRLRIVERHQPYAALVGVLDDLLAGQDGAGGLAGAAREIGADAPRLAGILPVLEDVAGLGLAPTARSEALADEARRVALEELLGHLFARATRGRRLLVILDDLQYLDAGTLAFLAEPGRLGAGLRLAATVTTESPGLPPALRSFATACGAREVALAPLEEDALARLASRELGEARIGPDLLDLLSRRTQGNPLHVVELLRLLVRDGLIATDSGEAELGADARLPGTGAIPESLRDLVMTRLDRLPPAERRLVQVASCAGTAAAPGDLARILGEPEPALRAACERLVAGAVLEAPRGEESGAFGFSHETVRSVAYAMMSFGERRRLHARIADLIASGSLSPGRNGLGDVARHLEGAERWPEAIAVHERTARRALRILAHADAVVHAQAALELACRHGVALAPSRRARLLAVKAAGHHENIEMRAAESLFTAALAALGAPVPASAPAAIAAVIPALAEQAARRLIGVAPRRAPADGAEVQVLASRIHENLAEIAYFDGNLVPVLYHTLRSLNLAERVGETSTAVAGFAALAIGFESVGLGPLADYYIAQSARLAGADGDSNDIAYSGLVAGVLHAGRADWARVEEALARSEALYAEIGAPGRWQQTAATRLHVALNRGQVRPDAPMIARLAGSVTRKTGPQVRVWLAAARLAIALRHDRDIDPALVADLVRLGEGGGLHSGDLILADGLAAAGLLSLGRTDEAMRRVRRGLASIARSRPTAWHLSGGLACCALVPLLVGRASGAGALPEEFARAEGALWRYQRRMRVARHKAHLLRGLGLACAGSARPAARHLRAARDWSRQLGLADDTGLVTALARRAGAPLPLEFVETATEDAGG